MTSSHSKTFVYVRPHENDKPAFTKTPLWRPFENPRFWYPKTPFTYGRKVERRKKSLFLKISGDVSTQPRPQGFSLKNGWGGFLKGKALGTRLVRTGSVFFYLPEAISLALASKSVSQSFAAWILNLSASSGTVIIV